MTNLACREWMHKRRGGRDHSQPPLCKRKSYYLAEGQEPETFFTLVTLNVLAPALLLGLEAPLAAALPDALAELEAEAVPFTSTSLLTLSLSFEVSPSS